MTVVAAAALVVGLVGWRGTAALPRAVAVAACGPAWVTAWQAAMQPGQPPRAIAGGGTLRMIVRPQVGGAQVRVRLTNVYGSAPLAVDAVSAARAGGPARAAEAGSTVERAAQAAPAGAAVDPESERPVTFAGRAATVIPPGEEALSDPVPVAASGSLAVTIAVPALPPVISEHPVALQTSWLAPPGSRRSSVRR